MTSRKYFPAFKDDKGNRVVILARNMVFDDRGDAFAWHLSNGILWIPFGLIADGVYAADLDENGQGSFPHVLCNGPMRSDAACISGPLFEEAMREAGPEVLAELERHRAAEAGA